LRTRHSTIVNIERFKELRPLFRGEHLIVLRDGTELTSSRRYRKNLGAILAPYEFPDLGKADLKNELSFSSERPPGAIKLQPFQAHSNA